MKPWSKPNSINQTRKKKTKNHKKTNTSKACNTDHKNHQSPQYDKPISAKRLKNHIHEIENKKQTKNE